jgi:hypothetical protein
MSYIVYRSQNIVILGGLLLADFRPYRKCTVCIGKYAQDQHFLLADTYEPLEGSAGADPGDEGNFINPLGYWNEPEPVFKIYV